MKTSSENQTFAEDTSLLFSLASYALRKYINLFNITCITTQKVNYLLEVKLIARNKKRSK